MNYWFFTLPVIAAITGWLINSLLIYFAFHPRQPKKIVGISFQGSIPKNQFSISRQLGTVAAQEFSLDIIEQKITDTDTIKKVMPLIEEHIDEFLKVKLPKEMPVISMFVGDKTIGTLKQTFMKEIETMFPAVMIRFATNLKDDLDISQIVTKQLASITPERLEHMIRSTLRLQIRYFKIAGAIAGLLIGLIQLAIMYKIS